MKFETWLERANQMHHESVEANQKFYFIKEEGKEGYFAFEYEDWEFWGVEPGEDYESVDQYIGDWSESEKFWRTLGIEVALKDIGKWRALFCTTEPEICDLNRVVAQEVWVCINGFWYDMPRSATWIGSHHKDAPTGELISLRSRIAAETNLHEKVLFELAAELKSLNLGLAIVPLSGSIHTFEMESLEVAIGDPEALAASHLGCQDFRLFGIGKVSYSLGAWKGLESMALSDVWYEKNVVHLNKPLADPKKVNDAIESICEFSKFINTDVGQFLNGDLALKLFRCMSEAGYGVAIIPLGGRTLWVP